MTVNISYNIQNITQPPVYNITKLEIDKSQYKLNNFHFFNLMNLAKKSICKFIHSVEKFIFVFNTIRFPLKGNDFKRNKEKNIERYKLTDNKYSKNKLSIGLLDTSIQNPFNNELLEFIEVDNIYHDKCRENLQKQISRKNSLFLQDKKRFKFSNAAEILHNAEDIYELAEADPKRFIRSIIGTSHPVLDTKHQVIYKVDKNPSVETMATKIRFHLDWLGITNVILPPREIWTRRLQDGRISTLLIEGFEDKLLTTGKSMELYNSNPLSFNLPIFNLVKLLCFTSIGDILRIPGYRKGDTAQDILRKLKKGVSEGECLCNFNNLPIRRVLDKEGKATYEFVIVDLDVVKEPSHSTVENLLHIFPRHKDLILDTVSSIRPRLLEGLNRRSIAVDLVHSPDDFVFTKDQMIEKYKNFSKELHNRRVEKYKSNLRIIESSSHNITINHWVKKTETFMERYPL